MQPLVACSEHFGICLGLSSRTVTLQIPDGLQTEPVLLHDDACRHRQMVDAKFQSATRMHDGLDLEPD
eukprot:3348139-Prymnesium_polylepis.1